MMNRRFISSLAGILMLGCLCVCCGAETKSGPVKLAESKFGPPDNAPAVRMGKTVKLTAKFYISDFFGSKVINAGATVKNSGAAPMFYVFSRRLFRQGQSPARLRQPSQLRRPGPQARRRNAARQPAGQSARLRAEAGGELSGRVL